MININRDIINRSSISDLVVVIFGQSNTGNAPTAEAPGHITTAADVPGCSIWYPGDSSWSNLRLGTNGSHTGSPSSKQLYAVTHEIGYQLNQIYPTKNIRFIMAAVGGTPMNVSGSDPFWRSDAAQQLYRTNLVDTILAALATLSSYIFLGTLGIHAESDTTALQNANRYGMLQRHLLESYYRVFGRHKVICSKVPLIDPTAFPYRSNVNSGMQDNYDDGVFDVIIDTDACEVSGDLLHLSGDGITALANLIVPHL